MGQINPVSPGEMLEEAFLKPRLTKYRLAKDIGVPPQRIGEIVAGRRAITSDTDTKTIAVTDATQVSISGNVLTLNPTVDMVAAHNFTSLMANTAIKDASGNAYAGISDNTTLNFTAAQGATISPVQKVAWVECNSVSHCFVKQLKHFYFK